MIKQVFKQNFFTIVIVPIFIVCIIGEIYTMINKPKEDEIFEYFFTANTVDKSYFSDFTNELVDKKAISITYTNEGDDYYSVVLQTQGIISADLLIVESTLFDQDAAKTSFIPLTEDLFNQYSLNKNDYTFKAVGEDDYAVIVKNDTIDYFKDYITYYDQSKTYVMAINKASIKQDEAALIMMNLLKTLAK